LIFIFQDSVTNQEHNKLLNELKSGKTQLVCNMKDGAKVIEPSKIVDFEEDTNTFIFKNGSAKSCYLEDTE
jgi:hypothetical protein